MAVANMRMLGAVVVATKSSIMQALLILTIDTFRRLSSTLDYLILFSYQSTIEMLIIGGFFLQYPQ